LVLASASLLLPCQATISAQQTPTHGCVTRQAQKRIAHLLSTPLLPGVLLVSHLQPR
jgi:hypothetical protein